MTNIVNVSLEELVKSIRKSGRPYPLIYISHERDKVEYKTGLKLANSEEVKNWMENRDQRDLITELAVIRGWEDKTVMVINYDGMYDHENMCLRAISNLVLVIIGDRDDPGSDSDWETVFEHKTPFFHQSDYEAAVALARQSQDEKMEIKDSWGRSLKIDSLKLGKVEIQSEDNCEKPLLKPLFPKGFLIKKKD